MKLFETTHKRKSAIITAVILGLILAAIFNLGLRYLDPPEEYGLAINFGDSNVGNGDPVIKSKATNTPKKVEEKLEKKEEILPKETIKEKIITQTTKDAPVVETPKKKKEEKPVDKKKVEKPKETPKPKPTKESQDILNSLLKGNSKDGEDKGEGDDTNTGVKGAKNGDPKSSKYYGNAGSGGDSNYNLAGRKALSKPIEKPDCNEEGIVVVSIEVDNNGKVIKATPGVKGSTNTAACLLKPAKAAALKTTWNPDPNAPNKQRGTIIYKFTLTK